MELNKFLNECIDLATEYKSIFIPDFIFNTNEMNQYKTYAYTAEGEPCYPILTNYFCIIMNSLNTDIEMLIKKGECEKTNVREFLSDKFYDEYTWINELDFDEALEIFKKFELTGYFGYVSSVKDKTSIEDLYKVRLEFTLRCLFLIWYCVKVSGCESINNVKDISYLIGFTCNMCANLRYEWISSETIRAITNAFENHREERVKSGSLKNIRDRERGFELIEQYYNEVADESTSIADAIRFVSGHVYKLNSMGQRVNYADDTIRKWVKKYLQDNKR